MSAVDETHVLTMLACKMIFQPASKNYSHQSHVFSIFGSSFLQLLWLLSVQLCIKMSLLMLIKSAAKMFVQRESFILLCTRTLYTYTSKCTFTRTHLKCFFQVGGGVYLSRAWCANAPFIPWLLNAQQGSPEGQSHHLSHDHHFVIIIDIMILQGDSFYDVDGVECWCWMLMMVSSKKVNRW